jgi:hypothetical protein
MTVLPYHQAGNLAYFFLSPQPASRSGGHLSDDEKFWQYPHQEWSPVAGVTPLNRVFEGALATGQEGHGAVLRSAGLEEACV